MWVQKIKELIRQGEGSQIEFKKTMSSYLKAARILCAFANTKGGTILIGVEDNKSTVSIDSDEESYVIMHAAEFYCQPEVLIEIETVEYNDKPMLVVVVPESDCKPHCVVDEELNKLYYVRADDKCLLASDTVIDVLRTESKKSAEKQGKKATNNERMLMDYLKLKRKITLKEYAKLINVSKRRANKILVDLVNEGALYEFEFEKKPYYMLSA